MSRENNANTNRIREVRHTHSMKERNAEKKNEKQIKRVVLPRACVLHIYPLFPLLLCDRRDCVSLGLRNRPEHWLYCAGCQRVERKVSCEGGAHG